MSPRRKAKTKNPRNTAKSPEAGFRAALRLHQGGRLEDAAGAYRTLLRRHPRFAPALANLGHALRRLGREKEAEDCYRRAAELPDAGYEIWFNLGNLQLDRRAFAHAAVSYQRVLGLAADFAPAHFQRGLALRGQGRLEPALAHFLRAVSLEPSFAKAEMNLGITLRALGRLDEALARYRRALALTPDSWECHYNLARALDETGAHESFEGHFQKALELAPDPSAVHFNLAEALLERAEFARAERHFRQVLAARADHPRGLIGLGQCLYRSGRKQEALTTFRRVYDAAGDDALLLADLASAQWRYKLWREGTAALRRVAELLPNHVDAHVNLARALGQMWEIEAAITTCDRALALDPDCARAIELRGVNLVKQGRIEEGLAAYETAARLDPDNDKATISGLFSSLYSDRLTPEAKADLHRDKTASWCSHPAPAPMSYPNSPDPERPLRIGYLSPDFKPQHPVAIFLEPVLTQQDRARFTSFCYSSVDTVDDCTARFETLSQNWREVAGWHDERLARQIRDDRIDIIVDLAGHTAGSRLRALCGRPAPVQACALGYPHSTGVEAIDYLIADGVVCPPENDHLCSETVMRLDRCVFCFSPDREMPPVDIEAARARQAVCFGSFNHLPKVTPTTVSAWARILTRVADARLKLKSVPFTDSATRERYWQLFEQQGIGRDRVELVGPSRLPEMMAEYGDIDIGLDPIPYNGGTTTAQALWMGVPVITLAGGNFCSRMSASLLGRIGLDELVAETIEDYVSKAVALAGERDRRLALRADMRDRMSRSSLTDTASYTRNLEALYRQMWRHWCRTRRDPDLWRRIEHPGLAARRGPLPRLGGRALGGLDRGDLQHRRRHGEIEPGSRPHGVCDLRRAAPGERTTRPPCRLGAGPARA